MEPSCPAARRSAQSDSVRGRSSCRSTAPAMPAGPVTGPSEHCPEASGPLSSAHAPVDRQVRAGVHEMYSGATVVDPAGGIVLGELPAAGAAVAVTAFRVASDGPARSRVARCALAAGAVRARPTGSPRSHVPPRVGSAYGAADVWNGRRQRCAPSGHPRSRSCAASSSVLGPPASSSHAATGCLRVVVERDVPVTVVGPRAAAPGDRFARVRPLRCAYLHCSSLSVTPSLGAPDAREPQSDRSGTTIPPRARRGVQRLDALAACRVSDGGAAPRGATAGTSATTPRTRWQHVEPTGRTIEPARGPHESPARLRVMFRSAAM